MDHSERCKKIVSIVDTLSRVEQEELFRMIHKERNDYTRNNHGVFINLLWISESLLTQIEQYIEFCNRSKHELQKYESICDVLNAKIHDANEQEAVLSKKAPHQGEKDSPSSSEVMPSALEDDTKVSKVTTSMRFYLLKKRFSKTTAQNNNLENDLKIEPYLLSN